jgi:hypothetical protein
MSSKQAVFQPSFLPFISAAMKAIHAADGRSTTSTVPCRPFFDEVEQAVVVEQQAWL